jgi:hypothetical protein
VAFQQDLLTRITKVNWPEKLGLTKVEMNYTVSLVHANPVFSYRDPFGGDHDPFAEQIKVVLQGQPDADIVDPPSPEMLERLAVWSSVPFRPPITPDLDGEGSVTIYMNTPKIKTALASPPADPPRFMDFTFHTPKGGDQTSTSIIYWVWDTSWVSSLDEAFLHQYTMGNPVPPHIGIVTIPKPFGTEAEAEEFVALLINQDNLAIESRSESFTTHTHLAWSIGASLLDKDGHGVSEAGASATTVETETHEYTVNGRVDTVDKTVTLERV